MAEGSGLSRGFFGPWVEAMSSKVPKLTERFNGSLSQRTIGNIRHQSNALLVRNFRCSLSLRFRKSCNTIRIYLRPADPPLADPAHPPLPEIEAPSLPVAIGQSLCLVQPRQVPIYRCFLYASRSPSRSINALTRAWQQGMLI